MYIRSGREDEVDPRVQLDIERGLPDIEPVPFDAYKMHGEGNVGTDRDRHRHRGIKVLCKHWLRGLCKKETACEFLHEYDLSKMPICYFYVHCNSCTSDTCQYLHTTEEDGNLDCPHYVRGFCRFGPRCLRRHQRLKACANYILGFCHLGKECPFAHPKFDPVEVDGDVTCHRCGQRGHKMAQCPSGMMAGGGPPPPGGGGGGGFRGSGMPTRGGGMGGMGRGGPRDMSSVRCYNCQGMGHYATACPMPSTRGGGGPPPRGGGGRPPHPGHGGGGGGGGNNQYGPPVPMTGNANPYPGPPQKRSRWQ